MNFRKNQFFALVLFLIYGFGILFSNHIHQHIDEVIKYDQANTCEKAIYFDEKESSEIHKQHYSKPLLKCQLCDSHNLSVHFKNSIFNFDFSKLIEFSYSNYNSTFKFLFSSFYFNKGPPSFDY